MAAIPISISGVMYDKTGRTQTPVYIVGSAQLVGVSIGGGPIVPPEEVSPPPGVPTHPIVLPGEPTHPIVLPEPPDPEVPAGTPPSEVVKDAPAGGWGYYTDATGVAYSAYRPREDEHGPK